MDPQYIQDRHDYFMNELSRLNYKLGKWTLAEPREVTGKRSSYTRIHLERIRNTYRAQIKFVMDAIRALELMEENNGKRDISKED